MVAFQAPLSMGFTRQEYWGGLPFPSPGDLPDTGIKHVYSACQMDSLPLNHQGNPWNTRDVQKLRKWSEIWVVAPPHCRGHPHPFFPGVPLCLASTLTNSFSACSPTCCAMSLKINSVPSFTIFASLRNAFFYWGQKYIYIYTDGCQ